MINSNQEYDVIIIGAGPSGALAASLLVQNNLRVLVVEKQHFPRFSIGESLLPQSMTYLEQANLLSAVEDCAEKLGFQYKNGAVFSSSNQESIFDFSQKLSDGPEYTYQVKRAEFDQLLAQKAQEFGADFAFGYAVNSIEFTPQPILNVSNLEAQNQEGAGQAAGEHKLRCKFVLDASGFARVLPRLLNLDLPSDFPVRSSVFAHISDNITDSSFDRNKILIESHPELQDVWYWLIPFSDGTASVGCVAQPQFFDNIRSTGAFESTDSLLLNCIEQTPRLSSLLTQADIIRPAQQITGYSSNVKQLYGEHYALRCNAGEILDPIFSSGVTIAFKSASLASDCLLKQFNHQPVCWETEFAQPLKTGVDTFKAFVHSWYQGQLQQIIQFQEAPQNVREMICSVLAGYAWDKQNPYNQSTQKRLDVLGELCAS